MTTKTYDQVDDLPIFKSEGDDSGLPVFNEPVKKKETPILSGSASASGVGSSGGLVPLEGGDEAFKKFKERNKRYEDISGFKVDEADPVASAKKSILRTVKKPRISSAPTVSSTGVKRPMESALAPIEPEDKGVPFSEASKDLKAVENWYRLNTNRSVGVLSKATGLTRDQLYSDAYDDQIKQSLQEGNNTQALAYDALQDAKKANKTIQEGGTLKDMAVRFAGKQDPSIQKQIDAQRDEFALEGDMFGEATTGRFMFDMINNPAFQQEIKNNPALAQELKQEAANLTKNNPAFGKAYFGNIISQEMENMGINNGILNVVTKDEFDKVVQSLKEKGEITLADEAFINENLRGDTGLKGLGKQIIGRENISTPGLVENTLQGAFTGTENLGKGIAEITGARSLLQNEEQALKTDVERAITDVNVKPENTWHEITQEGGKFLGQSLSIGAGGGVIKAAKIAKNPAVALGLAGGIQAYANYAPEARQLFPGDALKQRGFATVMSGIEALTENIFRDDKVVKGLLKEFKPLVKNTIEDFTQKKISAAAARQVLEGGIKNVISKVPEAAKSFTKAVRQNTAEEVIAQGLGQVTKGVFEGKPMSEWMDAEDLANTARQAFLGSAFIGALSTRADLMKSRGITSKQIYLMARDPEYWANQMQEAAKLDEDLAAELPDKLKNLEYATSLLQELDTQEGLTEKQKAKYLLTSLDSKVKSENLSTKTDPIIKAKEDAGAFMSVQENEKIKQDILEGKDDGTYEGDTSDEMSKQEIAAAKILAKANLPGMYDEMAEENPVGVLQEIAQQAQGIDKDGNALEGGGRRQDLIDSGVPEKVIDEAIKLYPKKESPTPMQSPEGAAETDAVPSISETQQNEKTATTEVPITPKTESATTAEVDEAGSTTEEGGAIPPTEPPAVAEGTEGEQPLLSGIRKALVSENIVRDINLEKIGDKEMMALGRRVLDTGEVNPRALVEKIIAERSGVLTPAQVVGMITYKADIDNQLRDAYTESNRRRLQGEDQGTLPVEIKNLEREVDDFDVAAVITAAQQSSAFRLRQYMLDSNYNVITQIEKYKANNDGFIPPEVEEKFRELDKKLKEVKEKIADAEAQKELDEAQEAINNIKEDIDRELKRTGKPLSDQDIEKRVKEGVAKEIDAIYEKLPKEKRSAADKAIQALENLQKKLRGKSYSDATGFVALIDAGITTIKNAIKAGVAIVDAIEMGINKIKELAAKKGIKDFKEDEFRKDVLDGFKAEGISTLKKKDEITLEEDGSLKIPESKLRDLVESGVTDINDLVDKIHAEAVKLKPEFTKREVRDFITDYGKKVNPKADDVQRQLNTAKRIGRLLSELEDLENKKKKEKNPSTKAKISQKERDLKRQIRALEKEAGIDNRKKLTDEEKLSAAKERVKNRIAELQRKIKNKDFAKSTKLPKAKDDELVKLESQKQALQQQFDEAQYKVALKQRTWWQKTEDVLLEVTGGVVRGLVASFDVSALFVQGMKRLFIDLGKSGFQLITLQKIKPNRSFRAIGAMFSSLFSKEYADNYLNKVKASPAYPLMQASKLAIDDKAGHVSVKEGLFISNWVNLIWNHIAAPIIAMPISVGTVGDIRKAYNIAKAINPYAASQRAFDGYVNSVRVNSFLDFAESLKNSGYNPEADAKIFEKAADVINTTTGRGSLGAADASSKWLNIFLFAPRKVISEVKLYTPYAFLYYSKLPAPVRKKALIDLGIFASTFITANALVWAALKGQNDDDEDDNFWNMRSSDFMTHKIGNKRISIGGGAKSMLVFQARLFTGKFVDQYGNETDLGDRYGKQINTRWNLITEFIAGKASPAIGVAKKKLDEKKGLEVDDADIIKDLTMPIFLQDLNALYKDSPASVSAILTAFSLLGANARAVDNNKNNPFTDEDKKDPTFKYFLDKGMNLPNVVPASIEVADKETKTMKNLTDFPEEKIKQYQDLHKKNLKEELEDVKKKGYVYVDDYGNISQSRQRGYDKIDLDELTKEQFAKILKSAQVQATTKTKEKLFPK